MYCVNSIYKYCQYKFHCHHPWNLHVTQYTHPKKDPWIHECDFRVKNLREIFGHGCILGASTWGIPSWPVRDVSDFNGHATPHQVSSRRPWDSIWEGVCFLRKSKATGIFNNKKRWIPRFNLYFFATSSPFLVWKKNPWFWRCVFFCGEKSAR